MRSVPLNKLAVMMTAVALVACLAAVIFRPYSVNARLTAAFEAGEWAACTELEELMTQDAEALIQEHPELESVSYRVKYGYQRDKDAVEAEAIWYAGPEKDTPIAAENDMLRCLTAIWNGKTLGFVPNCILVESDQVTFYTDTGGCFAIYVRGRRTRPHDADRG